ncbi:MAG: AI-2E family transporter, partial [Clostridia bacterium]
VKGFTGVLSNWIMGIVVCAYTLLERDSLFKLVRVVCGLFMKESTMDTAGQYIHRISAIFYQFFFGKMVDSLIIGILAIIGFSLLRVPYAALLGIIVMVFNMIPYFGPIIGAVPAVLITLLVKDVYLAIWTALFILVLQQFDGIWLGPKILGGSVGVSPFWVIFAIVVFGGLFGIWGMIFGVPIIAAIQMLAGDYLDDGKLNLTISAKRKNKEKAEESEQPES